MISENNTKIMSLGVERRNLVNKISSLDEKKFIEISKKIETSYKEVQEKYDELGSVASPVVENKYLWGLIKTTDIEKSLDGLLAIIQGLAKCTLGAFKANGENLEAILELMKILVSIENDLYKQLEDSDCSKENIANLLHDLCSQYNIDSNAIEGLFEYIDPNGERAKTLEKDGYTKVNWGKDIIDNEKEYNDYIFCGLKDGEPPIYLLPINPIQISNSNGTITNGYGFLNE